MSPLPVVVGGRENFLASLYRPLFLGFHCNTQPAGNCCDCCDSSAPAKNLWLSSTKQSLDNMKFTSFWISIKTILKTGINLKDFFLLFQTFLLKLVQYKISPSSCLFSPNIILISGLYQTNYSEENMWVLIFFNWSLEMWNRPSLLVQLNPMLLQGFIKKEQSVNVY